MTTTIDPATIWSQALAALQLRMPRGAFDNNLRDTVVASSDPPAWTIAARSEESREFLTGRLKGMIEAALAPLVGYEPELSFVVAARPGRPELAIQPEMASRSRAAGNGEANGHAGYSDTAGDDFLFGLNYEQAWFGKDSPGYDRMLKYWGQFWRAYLSRLSPVAYTLWEYLQVADKRNVNAPDFTWWTPAKKYNFRPLARVVGCAPVSISGGFRQCSIFNAALASGQELEACCKAYHPHLMNETRTGNPQCIHWVKGAFEVLYEEGLLAIQVVTGAPKSSYCLLQVWRLLPLLTPRQVATMHEVEQFLHENWLDQNGYKVGCTPEQWNSSRAWRAVMGLPGRQAGRTVWGEYQPNPLLPGYTGSDRPAIAPVESNSEVIAPVESNRNGHGEVIAPVESNSDFSGEGAG
jgi:hypothetical protein